MPGGDRLGIEHVQRGRGNLPAQQGRHQVVGIDQRAPRGVHQHHAGLHRGDAAGVDHVLVFSVLGQCSVTRSLVREDLVERGRREAGGLDRRRVDGWIVHQHFALECLQPGGHLAADPPEADHADGHVLQGEAALSGTAEPHPPARTLSALAVILRARSRIMARA